MIRRLLRRLAEWVTDDPSADVCLCGGYAPHCQVFGHENDRDDGGPFLLTPGSYEVPPEVERHYGREVLDEINRGTPFPPFLDDWNSPEDAAWDAPDPKEE